ncbi:MAG: helix-turn-helix domain-containing protein [Nanoarchaeota archaeon]|nr:helix-turn-helix domain-containing protein [Nanoarchaeota archaeon]
MEIEKLVALGFTRREAGAYLALLELEEAKAGEIATQAKEDRTNIYDSLRSLIKKGIVSSVLKGNKTYYRVSPPEKLRRSIEEKEKVLQELLPALERRYRSHKPRPTVESYEGKEGVKAILSDILEEGKPFVCFGATDKAAELLPEYTQRYLAIRERKKIHARQLYTEGGKVLESPVSEFRALPKEYASPATTIIYGDKVAIFMWFVTPLTVVLIKSKEAAKAYKSHFEFMWKSA